MADLSVRFKEPKFPEPTVGGLTGQQLSLLRQWEDEGRCDFEDELRNRCPDATAEGSRFCRFHDRAGEPTYDEYDAHRDREFE